MNHIIVIVYFLFLYIFDKSRYLTQNSEVFSGIKLNIPKTFIASNRLVAFNIFCFKTIS